MSKNRCYISLSSCQADAKPGNRERYNLAPKASAQRTRTDPHPGSRQTAPFCRKRIPASTGAHVQSAEKGSTPTHLPDPGSISSPLSISGVSLPRAKQVTTFTMQYLPEIDCKIPSLDILTLIFGELLITPYSDRTPDPQQIHHYHGPSRIQSSPPRLAMRPTA